MDSREMVCTACPVGCYIIVKEDKNEESGYKVINADCDRGKAHGIKEVTNPTRLITSTVKIENKDFVLPVRTAGEIPKAKIFDVIDEINKTKIQAPIKVGDVIIENVLGLEVDIIASKSVV